MFYSSNKSIILLLQNVEFQLTTLLPLSGVMIILSFLDTEGCPRGVMGKAMDCEIVVSEFIFQSRDYVHFLANTLGKGMNLLILPAVG